MAPFLFILLLSLVLPVKTILPKQVLLAAIASTDSYSPENLKSDPHKEWRKNLAYNVKKVLIDPFEERAGIVLETNEEIVIGFRGTGTIFDWMRNLIFDPTTIGGAKEVKAPYIPPEFKNMMVHKGFLLSASHMFEFVLTPRGITRSYLESTGKKIIFTGHSAGGAIAWLAAFLLFPKGEGITVMTFGTPKFVAKESIETVIKHWNGELIRFEMKDDVVPTLPKEYREFGKYIKLRNADGGFSFDKKMLSMSWGAYCFLSDVPFPWFSLAPLGNYYSDQHGMEVYEQSVLNGAVCTN